MSEQELQKVPVKRWVRILLITSLTLNLLVVGVVAGAFLRGDGPRGRGIDLTLGPYARALSPEDRAAVREGLRGRDDLRRLRPADFDADLRDLLAVLRSDSFDRDALAAILARQRDRVSAFQQAGQEALLDRIAAMDPEARAAFADRLAQELRHRRPDRN